MLRPRPLMMMTDDVVVAVVSCVQFGNFILLFTCSPIKRGSLCYHVQIRSDVYSLLKVPAGSDPISWVT